MKNYIYSDINEKWVKNGQGDIKLSLNEESVKTSLVNIITTSKGERVFLPEFGASLLDVVFDTFTQDIADNISNRIKTEVTRWDSRINLINIEFTQDSDNHILNATITFSVAGNETIMDVTIPVGRS